MEGLDSLAMVIPSLSFFVLMCKVIDLQLNVLSVQSPKFYDIVSSENKYSTTPNVPASNIYLFFSLQMESDFIEIIAEIMVLINMQDIHNRKIYHHIGLAQNPQKGKRTFGNYFTDFYFTFLYFCNLICVSIFILHFCISY